MTANYKQVKRKLKKLSKNEEKDDTLIIQKGNTFHVYDEYRIVKDKHGFNIYIFDGDVIVNTVFTSSSAISWCNAHKGNDVELARDIINTDRAIEFISNDIAYTKLLIKLKTTPHDHQSMLFARLTEYIDREYQLKSNLHKYIQRSKQIKSEGFSNEFTPNSKTNKFNKLR